jgi:ATP synthase protein I
MGAQIMTPDRKKDVFSYLTYSTLGLEMGISLVIGLAIGYYIDRFFGTKPIFLIVFMIFGLAAGMKRVYALWKKAEKEDEGDDSK